MSQMYQGQKIILVMDGAGWHKSKSLEVPENIEIVLLPPYSPELNPIEKFWQYIKGNVLKNRIYESIDSLMDEICQFISSMKQAQIASICACSYLLS